MKFVSFEDTTGIYETVFFPKAYDQFCHMLNATRPYILKGRVEEAFDAVTMNVHWMGFLDSGTKEGFRRYNRNREPAQGKSLPAG
jgi:DNA polymerase III alpha subunit